MVVYAPPIALRIQCIHHAVTIALTTLHQWRYATHAGGSRRATSFLYVSYRRG
jgi:hypothetical protein